MSLMLLGPWVRGSASASAVLHNSLDRQVVRDHRHSALEKTRLSS